MRAIYSYSCVTTHAERRESDGSARKAKFKAKGKGANLGLPLLPLTSPVTVCLLRKDSSLFWEATDSSPKRDDAEQFREPTLGVDFRRSA